MRHETDKFVRDMRPPLGTISEPVITVTGQGSGTYVFFYKPTVAGKYQVSVRLGKGDVPGSPFESIVHPGKTHTEHCGVSGLGLLCAGTVPSFSHLDVFFRLVCGALLPT